MVTTPEDLIHFENMTKRFARQLTREQEATRRTSPPPKAEQTATTRK